MKLAAIDVGTNSLHMIVVQVRPDLSFEVIDREKAMVRLGAGGLERGALTPQAMAGALQAMQTFRRLADAHGTDEIIAAATSAVRESSNGGDFLAAVRRTTGIRVREISGTEEARLIHLAAGYATRMGARTNVVIDIGGGSVEITAGTAQRMALGRSFRLGVIRLTEHYVESDPLARADERRLVRAIRHETSAWLRQVRRRGFLRVIGTSGTILALGALAAGRRSGDVRNLHVSAKAITRLRARLTALTLDERLALPGLDPKRADLSVAGIVLLDTLLEELRADGITLCDFALREGLILDYIRQQRSHIQQVDRDPDVRHRSVVELAGRCGVPMAHAEQVSRVAVRLFDQTARWHRLGRTERQWLEYAALLHDIGTHISYERHHKHSQYLILNGDLRGFDPRETAVMALVARYHRQSLPKKAHAGFGELPRAERRAVRWLGALLRLAEALDRSHSQVVRDLRVTSRRNGSLVITIDAPGDADLELRAAERQLPALAGVATRPVSLSRRATRRRARR